MQKCAVLWETDMVDINKKLQMDSLLTKIIAKGKGSATSGEIRDIAKSIAPKKAVSHKDIRDYVTNKYPDDVKAVRTPGGRGSKYRLPL